MSGALKRIVFFAADPIALPVLNFLHQEGSALGYVLRGVVSQPDRRVGRGQKWQANPVAAWAESRGLSVWKPAQPDEALIASLRAEAIDLFLVMAYGHLLRKNLRSIPPLGIWNLHASLLPRYRGSSPAQGVIDRGDRETGVTFMRVVARMDAGEMVDREIVPVDPSWTGSELEEKLGEACPALVARVLPRLRDQQSLDLLPQDEDQVTFTRKMSKQDSALDWSRPAVDLLRRIRALQPWPGAAFPWNGQNIRVIQAEVESESLEEESSPGTVLAGEDALRLATGQGVLRILTLQRPGGRQMEAADFLRGFPIPAGSTIPSGEMRPLVLSPAEWEQWRQTQVAPS